MLKKDVLDYFKSLNKTEKFNWICNFMILALHKECDERNTISWYRNSDSNHWLYNNGRDTFRTKIINSYKKPTQAKLHSIAAEVHCFYNNEGLYDNSNMRKIRHLYSYLYSYIGQNILRENNYSIKKSRHLTNKSECIKFAVFGWVAINNNQDESKTLSELKNLSIDFDNDYWKNKDQIYKAKEYVEPVIERDIPDLSKISGAGQTKMQIYKQFINGVQSGQLPSIDVAIRAMETADDHNPEGQTNKIGAPQNNISDTSESKNDLIKIKLRNIPKYLQHPVFGVDSVKLTQEEFLSLVDLENKNEIFYNDCRKEKQLSNFKIIEVGRFQYNVLNKNNDKPLAYIDAFVQDEKLLYMMRYFDVETECFFHKLYDIEIEVN
jgi:hypothetical protein